MLAQLYMYSTINWNTCKLVVIPFLRGKYEPAMTAQWLVNTRHRLSSYFDLGCTQNGLYFYDACNGVFMSNSSNCRLIIVVIDPLEIYFLFTRAIVVTPFYTESTIEISLARGFCSYVFRVNGRKFRQIKASLGSRIPRKLNYLWR